MGSTLLVGNGVNRIGGNEQSWENVLRYLAGVEGAETILRFVEHKPFALLYEEILLRSTRFELLERETRIRSRVAELIDAMRPNAVHAQIMNSSGRHVLTTNYDYNLERSASISNVVRSVTTETKYSLYRATKVAKKNIWHIHGECRVPGSITLGYDQYSGYVQNLRSYATSERTAKGKSPFKRGLLDFDEDSSTRYSWLDVFFRDDIHIIGLTLDYTEIDLWWALTYKARLRARGFKTGTTHFYDCYDGEISDARKGRHSLFEALGIAVIPINIAGSYEEAYGRVLSICRSRGAV